MSSSTIIGIPTDDKAFERNCVPLFAGVINDPNVKLVGTRGKKQFGLDLIGKRDRDPRQPVGIQCKLITRGAKLSETVVRNEVTQALAITPPLTEFYVVTTASDEPALDLLAIDLSREQADKGRTIDIQVWGWDTLQDKIRSDPRALAAFDPDYSASTNRLIELGTETLAGQNQNLALHEQVLKEVSALRADVSVVLLDTERSGFEQHLDAQVDQYRDLMNAGKPQTALSLLEKLERTLGDGSSAAIRARIKANIAYARLKLGDEQSGAGLLADAYALNPSDPKVRANYILALALQGDVDGAWRFAVHLLADDPENMGAAGLAFQVAAMSSDALDPMAIVPAGLLDDLNVRIHRISFLRAQGEPGSWWDLAAKTFERFPEDGVAMRMAGDALIDAALSGRRLDRRSSIAGERQAGLSKGATLLQRHWDSVRLFENAAESNWIMVAYNLITAYRALGDLDQARIVADQVLALGSDEPDSFLAAAWTAIDQERFVDAIALLRRVSDPTLVTLPLMVALANAGQSAAVLEEATPERRAALALDDRQLFDVLVFRARRIAKADFDLAVEVEQLLTAWPVGISAHIAVADIYRNDKPEEAEAVAAKALSLFNVDTSFSDRVMFAQLSIFRGAWDDAIAALDGHVRLDQPTDELSWLAMAYANAGTRPRTASFFKSLAPRVIELPHYARLAGAAEHNRGDLKAAERYLRTAIAGDPADLRAVLLLASTLIRGNRERDAIDLLRSIDDDTVRGAAGDLMRLAHQHRRHGDVERALRLGYRVAAANREDENVTSSYPGLIFLDEALPPEVGSAGPAQLDSWFDLEGLDGTRDADGVIDMVRIEGVETFAPDHPLAAAVVGKAVGDEVIMPAEFGPDRRYRVRELKHKYIWLLHDIMASHAARFPDARSLFEMTMKDGDVQPILDMVRDFQRKDDVVADTYGDFPVPLAAVAAASNKPVLALADHLASAGKYLRTCLGSEEERVEAAQFVRRARGKGIVLDTLTVWQLREFGHLAAAKAFFSRLCIPQSTFDELLEVRAKLESNRGREFLTLGFKGEEAWRAVHTPEDTERQIATVNAIIADVETNCEILPAEGTADTRLEKMMGSFAAQRVFDPIHIARSEGLILVSEDLNLRQFAAQQKVIGGAWLQVVLVVLAAEGAIADRDYLIAVGMLGAMRHDHVWLDAGTMIGILTLDDPRAFALFEAAIRFMGGRKAEMRSHLSVMLGIMQRIWSADLPDWQRGRAVGRLLEQMVRSRPNDWKAVLHILDAELGKAAAKGNSYARRGWEYLADWIGGHFYNLEDIRSAEQVITEIRIARPMRAAKKRGPKRSRA